MPHRPCDCTNSAAFSHHRAPRAALAATARTTWCVLRRITELVDAGVNLAGIGRILELETRNTELESDNAALQEHSTETRRR